LWPSWISRSTVLRSGSPSSLRLIGRHPELRHHRRHIKVASFFIDLTLGR
jgi:hypothetical protein